MCISLVPTGLDAISQAPFYTVCASASLSPLISTAIAGLIGLTAGVTAAYFGNRVDVIIMRTVDLFLSLPSMLIALIAIVTLGPCGPYRPGTDHSAMGELRTRCARSCAKRTREILYRRSTFAAIANVSGDIPASSPEQHSPRTHARSDRSRARDRT